MHTRNTFFDHRSDQKSVLRPDALQKKEMLLEFAIEGKHVTKEGVLHNVRVSLAYLAAWLSGLGAVAIDNLMEDMATCEIARSQLWQWIHHKAQLEDGTLVTRELIEEALNKAENDLKSENYPYSATLAKAREHISHTVFSSHFIDFLSVESLQSIH